MQTDHAAQLAEQQKFFAESSALSTTEEAQILERLKQKQAAEELVTTEGNARIKEIYGKQRLMRSEVLLKMKQLKLI